MRRFVGAVVFFHRLTNRVPSFDERIVLVEAHIRYGLKRGISTLRIWDFRRGDDDDNRTSPHGGGFRRILLSGALEFNYVKASIGFLVLVMGPAMLVGIVPSVVVTLGRW